MDRGAWWATIHGVARDRIQLSMHTHSKETFLFIKVLFSFNWWFFRYIAYGLKIFLKS